VTGVTKKFSLQNHDIRALHRETGGYVSHHLTSKHQCTRLGLVPNLNSQASSPINKGWKPPYYIRKQKTQTCFRKPRNRFSRFDFLC